MLCKNIKYLCVAALAVLAHSSLLARRCVPDAKIAAFAPITDSNDSRYGQYENGISCGRYGRAAEDFTAWSDDLLDAKNNKDAEVVRYGGLFDGHGGKGVAAFLAEDMAEILQSELSDKDLFSEKEVTAALDMAFRVAHLAVKDEFAKLGDDGRRVSRFASKQYPHFQTSGSTAVVVLAIGLKLYVAHAGDSRAIVFDAQTGDVVFSSRDHSTDDEFEQARIKAAGGELAVVGGVARLVPAGLNLTRSIGDYYGCDEDGKLITAPGYTPVPEVAVVKLNPEKSYKVILLCDGVLEYCSSQPMSFEQRHKKSCAHEEEMITFMKEKIKDGCSDDKLISLVAKKARGTFVPGSRNFEGSTDDISLVCMSTAPLVSWHDTAREVPASQEATSVVPKMKTGRVIKKRSQRQAYEPISLSQPCC